MFSLHDVPRALAAPSEPYTVWARVLGSDRGTRCGDVVAASALPGARLALVVVDLIGGGARRARRAGAVGAHLTALLSLGVSPAAAVRFADIELQRGGWEDDVPPLASVFAAIADASNETLTYVAAAHETALLFGTNGTHQHLAATGPVAGLFETPCFAQVAVPFRRGESLVVVTDGVPDSHPAGGPFFGSAGTVRTATLALRHGDDPADALIADAMRHGAGSNDASAL
ncbi:MAG TPA: SpoIIE family protein phosphatase, partial [Xanthomonadales bacterium]|nr:SpoIIE family protein phosphatase [Xanthomonadales bacterium]